MATTGSTGNDSLTGMSGADTIDGTEGSDAISGLFGSDLLIGNKGDDSLWGHLGDDTMNGGGSDRIQDFDAGAGYRFGYFSGFDTYQLANGSGGLEVTWEAGRDSADFSEALRL